MVHFTHRKWQKTQASTNIIQSLYNKKENDNNDETD